MLRSYAAICLALENIYNAGGDMSTDAGGLLLTLRKSSTPFLLHVVNSVVSPLATLSRSLQYSDVCLLTAFEQAIATIASIEDLSEDEGLTEIADKASKMVELLREKGIYVEMDTELTTIACKKVAKQYIKVICSNIRDRFNDHIGQLTQASRLLKARLDVHSAEARTILRDLSMLINCNAEDLTNEWQVLRR